MSWRIKMHPILQQILDLLEHAPLTQTGKNDIQHTIRTEYYQQPDPITLDIPTRRIKLATPLDDPECECPFQHKHSYNNGMVCCFECPCAYTPEEHRKTVQRVNLLD